MPISPVLIFVVIVLLYLISSVKILAEYERGVIFRLGKLLPQPKGPGVILVFAPIDRIVRVSLRTVAFEVPPQDVITRDNVSVKVSAVLYYRVVDPRRAIVEVENYQYATLQLAQTTLRSVLGQAQLDDLLAERDRLNQQLQHILDERAEPWGIKVSAVEVKHVDLPADMQRSMARQAEAEREKAGRVGQAGAGRWRDCVAALEHYVALPADAHRNCRGKKLDDRFSAADRAAGAAEGLDVESSRDQLSRVDGKPRQGHVRAHLNRRRGGRAEIDGASAGVAR